MKDSLQKRCIQLIFTATRKKFCLNLHYNEDISYLFANGTDIIKFKAKESEIEANPLCLGNISEGFASANTKKKLDCMVLFLTLVLIIELLQLMIY